MRKLDLQGWRGVEWVLQIDRFLGWWGEQSSFGRCPYLEVEIWALGVSGFHNLNVLLFFQLSL
jgi:hypothetical protein